MAEWNREKVDSSDLNNGNEWEQGDRVARQELNAIINAGLYAQDFAEHLADTPDTSEANNVGIPTVDFVDNPNATTGKPYKRFKFSNLKGNKGDKGDKGDVGTQWYNSSYYEAGFRPSVGYAAVIAKSTIDGNPVLNDYIFFVNWYGTIGRVALVSDTTVTITVQTSIEAYVNADELLDKIYPIGSIYMSVNNVSPANFLGGIWDSINDTFLLASGASYTAGDTGGEATHKLTIDEMPSHTHTMSAGTTDSTNHEHSTTNGANVVSICPTLAELGYNPLSNANGGNQSHNNMPPYLVVNIWKRIA